MKKLLGLLLILGCGGFASCDDEQNQRDEVLKATLLLSKTWETGYVTIDGQNVTDLGYLLMQLSFTQNGRWTSSNANGLFASEGEWSFPDTPSGKNLSRLALASATFDIVLHPEGSFLILKFDRAGSGAIGGRTTKLNGTYEVFLLPKYVP